MWFYQRMEATAEVANTIKLSNDENKDAKMKGEVERSRHRLCPKCNLDREGGTRLEL